MLTPPTSRFIGGDRPFWVLEELNCPQGRLLCALCPEPVPNAVLRGLHPQELAYAASLHGDRRREWIAGRYCLAAALGGLDSPRAPVLTSSNGAPLLAGGTVGSISHKGPLTLAIVSENCRGVGVDVECIQEADSRLGGRVLTSEELGTLRTLDDASQAALFIMVHFTVKEAIYKCAEPSAQSLLDFDRIQLRVDPKVLSVQGEWLTLPACVRALDCRIITSVRIDGKWLMAASTRD